MKRAKIMLMATTATFLMLGSVEVAHADIWKDIGKGIERAAKDVVQAAEDTTKFTIEATGIPTAVRIAEGKSLKDALDPGVKVAKDAARSVAATAMIAQPMKDVETALIAEIAGDDAATVHAITQLPSRMAEGLPSALVGTTIEVSENIDNVENVVGIPLAAALYQAHAFYDDKAKPLPNGVKEMLGVYFSSETLNKARFVVDSDPNTLNGMINHVKTRIGHAVADNHAVVVGDIIVFAKMPATDVTEIRFWGHEVVHTAQYEKLGIDGFAAKYIANYSELEDEADREAQKMYAKLVNLMSAVTGKSRPGV